MARVRRVLRLDRAACMAMLLAGVWATAPRPASSQTPAPLAEPILDVKVTGNETLSLQKILPSIQTRAGRPFEPALLEDDVRRLNKTRLFLDVDAARPQRVPGGVIVHFHVVERPTIQDIQYVGSTLRASTLAKQVGLKKGEAIDPYAVEEARRKLQEYYLSKGYSKTTVSILEGNKQGDRRVKFLINEAKKQRIWSVRFVGNTIAGDGRLRTQIQSKRPFLYLFKGEVDRQKIEEDANRLTDYYRGLGYFAAKVGRDFEFNDDQNWLTLTFYINEGPRYAVRNVTVVGNKKFATEELTADLKLQSGDFFNRSAMTVDASALQDKYGAVGYVLAAVQPAPRFLDEPGQLDLVYQIEEGARFRWGNIDVKIEGENPHTRRTTVLNRLSIRPGEIADIRELRASERRLRASGLFLNDPVTGTSPKIVFKQPDAEAAEKAIARGDQRRGGFRGQSPDGEDASFEEISIPLVPDTTDQPTSRAVTWPRGLSPPVPIAQSVRRPAWPSPGLGPRSGDPSSAAPSREARPILPRFQSADELPSRLIPNVAGGSSAPPRMSSAASPAIHDPNVRPVQYAPPQGWGSQPPPSVAATPPGSYPPANPQASAAPQAGGELGGVLAHPGQVFDAPPVAASQEGSIAGDPLAGAQGVNGSPGGYSTPDELFPQEGYPFLQPDGEPTQSIDTGVIAAETQTGRFMFGVGVNSNAGLVGSIVVDEQNFDWRRWPRSWEEIRNATAFRGAGQQFRIEAVPGTQLQRYLFSFRDPYWFDTQLSFGLSGFYFTRRYTDWDEERLGGRVSLGYQFRPDLSATFALRAENVNISNARFPTPPQLQEVLGDNALYSGQISLAHDTRDSAFLATEGHRIELGFEQAFGDFSFPRATVEGRQHFLIHERPDGSGRHVLSLSSTAGFSGTDTPIFENFFAGGFSTLRGFRFRGASPRELGVTVGGRFQFINSVEYMLPLVADDMLRGVFFCDFGTVEQDISIHSDNFRVAPGFGLRITVPAMGPAPIALDLAAPITHAPGDQIQNFSFFVGFGRN